MAGHFMAKLLGLKSRSRKTSNSGNLFSDLGDWFWSLDKFVRMTIIGMLLIFIAIPFIIYNQQIFNQHAATNKTATIAISPSTGSYNIGDQFTINLVVDGGGQAFNAASVTVGVSSNLSVMNLTPVATTSGGCGFTYINTQSTPTATNPSFAGAILNGSSTSCIVYSLVVKTTASGPGTISLGQGLVKSYATNQEILSGVTSGSFTVNAPTPTPSATPTVPPTPLPTSTPTPTPTPVVVPPPTINAYPAATYSATMTLTGTNTSGTSVYINNALTGVTVTSPTTWSYGASLVLGTNNYSVTAKDTLGNVSVPVTASISLHRLADINGDGVIDLTDLSMFATDWAKTNPTTFNYALSDMNGDGIIDLTDFSILAKAYGN